MSAFYNKFDYLKLPLIDIQNATNKFSYENMIEIGGYVNIYKGQLLRSGELIDIVARRLRRNRQGIGEFYTEIMMLSNLKHQNMVSIVGFCDENGEKIIVNKYEAKGSLDQYIFDPVTLTWTRRLQICLAVARALSYIYYDQGRTFSVVHRNIKSSKILLDDKWEPKLSGFGLATMQPATKRHGLILVSVRGTRGYVDPTYVRSASVSHKSDVYSFGVVLYEVLSGRGALIREIGTLVDLLDISDSSPHENVVSLATLAKLHYENGNLNDIIDPGLQKQMSLQSLKVFSEVAYCCLNEQRS